MSKEAKEILGEKDEAFVSDCALRISISSEEYADLKANSAFLANLYACGLQAWEGYFEALSLPEIYDE
jgi:hypothetical protein